MHGKTIVITGASTGIGEELAVALAARGANLVLAARGTDGLAQAARRCTDAGGHAVVVPTDVTDPEACRLLIERAVDAFGGIDMLVANAGISMWARFEEITDLTIFERIMKVNYLGAVYCTHFALPHLKRSKGLLVAISSLTGKTGVPTRTGYAASKHAMQGFYDSLRIELTGAGVDVLVVSPGFVATGIRARALGPDGKPLEESPREEKHNHTRTPSAPHRDTMDVHTCVGIIVKAMQKRAREVVMTPRAKVGLFLKLVAPGLVDRIAARAVREK